MNKKRILIVDDSHEFSFLIVTLLKFHDDIEVVSETSPLLAVDKINDINFDLCIIDFLMDDINGIELIQKIRSSPKNRNAKCILLTAKELNDNELSALNEMNGLYTRKPIMPNEFYKQIIDIVNHD